jgi:hypothetical protein
MANGPMRQSIPLADTVRALSGDAAGLAKELERERRKLEREIQKSLDQAGQVDGKLTQKLNDLNKREQAARIYSDRDAARTGARRDMMAVRSFGGKVSGVADLANGRFAINNIEDAGDLLQAAGGRLARAGYVGAGNRLAQLGASVAAGVASVGLPVMAAAATATAFYDLGGQLGNALWGDPAEMEQRERRRAAFQQAVWSNRAKLGDQQTAFMLSQDSNPFAESWLQRDTMRNGQAIYDQANREERERHGYWYYAARPFRRKTQDDDAAAFVANRMKELEANARERRAAKAATPAAIQSRAIANERLMSIKAAEDDRWESRHSWGGY